MLLSILAKVVKTDSFHGPENWLKLVNLMEQKPVRISVFDEMIKVD